MKTIRGWRMPVALTASFSFAVATFPTTATATNTAVTQNSQPSVSEQTLSQNSDELQRAQASDNCRRVSTNGINLNVRATPNGRVVGSLADNTLVTIENRGTGGWVPIASPQKGYVYGAFLALCEQPVPPTKTPTPTDNCRQVSALGGLRVRQRASLTSPIIGLLADGQRVTIVNRGTNGWVPISSPQEGYVSGDYLKLCDRSAQPTPPPTSANCRRVSAIGGLAVRESPSIDSAVLGSVENGDLVTIVNRGANGWVPISEPLTGYIQAASLKLCQ
ncbi:MULTISPECIES: SH3 domain-containing protein [unclassified Coleofasciculus]|uniref:SH3 domain-containing protein n=1 Tax=unclassified Coleofasciculus TaxID=2692782 RepID=UPI00187E01CE|nr:MULTISPECIES: SH3 domain-containing protein [unclassified Coleofasciculus]MBE9127799.1 SH3 domain-containing protein [Coleofasciculus sp. LEGE 07081]MBE9150040.1 SH3 domain-containing protein [Coleofasciculus sp. LEGE 07092]